jgi:hypothetical protein
MASEKLQVVGSVPPIADGNPSTLLALETLTQREGVEFTALRLNAVAAPARWFHEGVSADPERAATYVASSEAERAGLKGRVFGVAAAAEFIARKKLNAPEASHWDVVQELPLLAMSASVLRMAGVERVRLMVPDVFPKESGVAAIAKHRKIGRFSTWNTDAANELHDQGFAVDLTHPYLLNAFRPESPLFAHEGVEIVMKTSGSGAPDAWVAELQQSLDVHNVAYAIHTPQHRISPGKKQVYETFNTRIQAFYNDLGGKTKILIGYPSELVGVAAELRDRGVDCWMISLPPRGAHELRNRDFGFKHDIIHSGLLPGGARGDNYELRREIRPADVHMVLQEAVAPSIPDGLIGRDQLWQG